MRARPLLPLAAAAAVAAALPARASAPPISEDEGLEVAVRAGWALPVGDTEPGSSLGDLADAKLPLAFEVGYRFDRRFAGALYLEFAPVSLDPSCAPGDECSAWAGRFGVLLRVHAAPRSRLDPWIAAGFGIEHLRAEAPVGGSAEAWALSWFGLEVPVEAGLDVRLSPALSLGPYASFTLAWFTSTSARPPGGPTTSGAIDDRATHGWAQAGLRMTLRL